MIKHWVETKPRGDGLTLDWGKWSGTVIEDLQVL